jgi:hypothetical protein
MFQGGMFQGGMFQGGMFQGGMFQGGMFQGDFEVWLNHFEHHAKHPRCGPHGLSDLLRPDERRLIASSIATFQLGEQSEGRTLLRAAQRFADERRILALVRIVELFIREEQRHAALLRAFMQEHRIALKKIDWTDGVFRRLRRLAGLELSLHIIISAELVGIVYYRALEAATGCQRLVMLCRTHVSDELAHVGFESQLLLALRAGRAAPVQTLIRLAHRAFFAGTAGVVWLTHRSVLRRAGHGARSFVSACLAQHAFYLEPVNVTLASTSSIEQLRRRVNRNQRSKHDMANCSPPGSASSDQLLRGDRRPGTATSTLDILAEER